MQKASAEAEFTVAVLSGAYLSSRWATEEWTAAVHQESLRLFRIEAVAPRGILASHAYVDLFGVGETTARERLLADVLRRERRKPAERPAFPEQQSARTEPPVFPGSPPPTQITNLPSNLNRGFVGRDGELRQIAEGLTRDGAVAISGLGGLGKTQLAAQYASRYADDYDLSWWIDAETPTTLLRDFAALAAPLGLPLAADNDDRVVTEGVRERLRHMVRWLIVFDNVPAAADLRQLLPDRGGDRHVLITSRSSAWAGFASPLRLEPLDSEAGARFLRERTGDHDADAAQRLTSLLGGLPLALNQAGAYAEATNRGLADYVDLFATHQTELLASSEHLANSAATVATTWELSFVEVKEREPLAADLLNVLAFFAATDVETRLWQTGLELPEPLIALADPFAFDRVLATLARYSLVERASGSLSIHRLVQQITRDRLSSSDRMLWSGLAVDLLQNIVRYDRDEPETWPETARLLPHIVTVCEHPEVGTARPRAVAELLLVAGESLRGSAAFARADDLLERAVAATRVAFGENDPQTAAAMSAEAAAKFQLGEVETAASLCERALEIASAQSRPDDSAVARYLNDLGVIYGVLGRVRAQREALQRALAIRERTLGSNHPETANSMSSLGVVLAEDGELEQARTEQERALAILESNYGPRHLRLTSALGSLGSTLGSLGDLLAEKAAHERALAIRTDALGDRHPDVATSLLGLGQTLDEMGQPQRARELHERALAIYEETFGDDHPFVATALRKLGSTQRDLADFSAAKAAHERALAISERAFGRDHHSVAASLNALASTRFDLGDYRGAKLDYQRALEITTATYGPSHLETTKNIASLASVVYFLGEFATAAEIGERSLRNVESIYGRDHPHVSGFAQNLASILRDLGQLERARALGIRVVDITERYYGATSHQYALAIQDLSMTLGALGDPSAVYEAHTRALAIRERVYGPDHPAVASTLTSLCSCLGADLGQLDEALAVIDRALEIHETVFGPRHPDVAASLTNRAGVLTDLGKLRQARAAAERAIEIDLDVFGPWHPDLSQRYVNLAIVYQRIGHPAARNSLKRAIEISERAWGPDDRRTRAPRDRLRAITPGGSRQQKKKGKRKGRRKR